MESIREDGADVPPQIVQGMRDPHEQSLHPARERASILGLGDQVHVIRLQRVLRQPETETIAACRERAQDPVARGLLP
jgi:hypothetical protein